MVVLAADLQYPVSVISPLLTGREWELVTVGPIKNKCVSSSHSSYSSKLLSGFKVIVCDLMIFHINLLNQIVFGHCEEHWADEGCANQESIWWYSSTLPDWQEQTETPVSIRTHFLPVQTCIIKLIGRIKLLLQVLNNLTAALKRNSLLWDALAAQNKEMSLKTIQAKPAAFKQSGKCVCSFMAFLSVLLWRQWLSSGTLFIIIISSLMLLCQLQLALVKYSFSV